MRTIYELKQAKASSKWEIQLKDLDMWRVAVAGAHGTWIVAPVSHYCPPWFKQNRAIVSNSCTFTGLPSLLLAKPTIIMYKKQMSASSIQHNSSYTRMNWSHILSVLGRNSHIRWKYVLVTVGMVRTLSMTWVHCVSIAPVLFIMYLFFTFPCSILDLRLSLLRLLHLSAPVCSCLQTRDKLAFQ